MMQLEKRKPQMSLSLVLVLFSFAALSQSSTPEIKNLYSFSLVNGLNESHSESIFGEQQLARATSVTHGFNFHYTRVLHPAFDMSAGLGFGAFPIRFKLPESYDPIGYGPFRNYFDNLTYKGFWRVELLASYRKQISENHLLRAQVGGGFVHYGGYSYGSQSYISYDTIQPAEQIFDLDISFNNRIKPFVSLGLELSKTLKNQDVFGLKLSYDHSFTHAFDGTYVLNNQTSAGNYINNGHFLNFHLTYTLTRSKHLQTIKELQLDPNMDRKGAGKLARKKKRYIDPKSMFINVSGGIGIGQTRVINDPNDILISYGSPSFLPRIAFEKGIKNQFYWELGYHSQLFWDVQKFSIMKYSYSASSAFYAYQFSGGGLYRWILPNNYNIINFHAGLTLGFHAENWSGYGGGSYAGQINGVPFAISYTSTSKIQSNILSSLYLGFSKDFRIVHNLFLSLSYRQQFGLIKALESTYAYSGLNIPYTEGVRTKINGTSKDFQLGFKVKFGGE